jgi:hypothetical protein
MERWERDQIESRIDRVEALARGNQDRLWEAERREGGRIHANLMVVYWLFIFAFIAAEVAVAVVEG